jgi:hypothetical protein
MADVGLERNPILCGFGDRCRYLPLELLEWIFAENEKWGSLAVDRSGCGLMK